MFTDSIVAAFCLRSHALLSLMLSLLISHAAHHRLFTTKDVAVRSAIIFALQKYALEIPTLLSISIVACYTLVRWLFSK